MKYLLFATMLQLALPASAQTYAEEAKAASEKTNEMMGIDYVHWPLEAADSIQPGDSIVFATVPTLWLMTDGGHIVIGTQRKQIGTMPILTVRVIEVSEPSGPTYLDVEYDVDHELLETYLHGRYIDYLFSRKGDAGTTDEFFQWLRNQRK